MNKKHVSGKEREALNAEVAKDIPAFMDRVFGPGKWQYDEAENLYTARDPKYCGSGFGFIAVRPNGTYFTGVRPLDVLQ